jgi:hypothetical protein
LKGKIREATGVTGEVGLFCKLAMVVMVANSLIPFHYLTMGFRFVNTKSTVSIEMTKLIY